MNLKTFDFNKAINYLIVIYAFVLPLSRAAINIVSILILILWVLEGKFKEKFSKLNKTYTTIFLLFIYMCVSYLWSENYNYANFYVITYLHYFLLSFAIYTSIKKEFVDKAVTAFISGIFVSELTSYSIFLGLMTKKNVLPSDPAPFMNHIEYSFYLAVAAIILIDRFFNTKEWKKKKIFSILFFISISFNLFIINGRTGQFTYVVILFLVIVNYLSFNFRNLFLSIFIGISAFFILYNISPNFHYKTYRTFKDIKKIDDISPCVADGARVFMIKVGSEIIKDNPVFGVGVGDTMNAFKKYVLLKYPEGKCTLKYNHLHNQYIQEGVQLGVLGIILLISIFYFLYKESGDKKFAFLIVIAVLLSFNGDVLLSRQFSTALITLVIVFVLKKENFFGQYNYNCFKQ